MYPNENMIKLARVLNTEFENFHSTTFSTEDMIFNKLADSVATQLNFDIPYEIIHCLARTRTYIRLRELNKKISFENCKRRLNKKMSKFTNAKP